MARMWWGSGEVVCTVKVVRVPLLSTDVILSFYAYEGSRGTKTHREAVPLSQPASCWSIGPSLLHKQMYQQPCFSSDAHQQGPTAGCGCPQSCTCSQYTHILARPAALPAQGGGLQSTPQSVMQPVYLNVYVSVQLLQMLLSVCSAVERLDPRH